MHRLYNILIDDLERDLAKIAGFHITHSDFMKKIVKIMKD